MANNLFISYDLHAPNQDYTSLIDEIKSLGDWASIQRSLWYVNSALSAEEAAKRLRAKMDSNDSLVVINAVNNEAYWYNLSDEVAKHIQNFWNR
ncbi:hypothetical protein J2Y65_000779 [Aeromonas salmonicida]|uniref:CRISPR-associated protein Cas2 n=1 Tax=Aeromonas salmonicida TaxID=645 RepID=UPI0028584AA4|nr:CRISPR-associated protein Cas2 [Aeromonas salmonicida]MDR6994145.1 hypothetical protein [Aeromonas salmonicida]